MHFCILSNEIKLYEGSMKSLFSRAKNMFANKLLWHTTLKSLATSKHDTCVFFLLPRVVTHIFNKPHCVCVHTHYQFEYIYILVLRYSKSYYVIFYQRSHIFNMLL